MATGTAGTTARDLNMQVKHTIARTLAYNTAGAATGVVVGAIPAGAIVTCWNVHVTTAFNAGTTNPIAIGTTGTGADVAAAASITSATAGAYSSANVAAAGARGALPSDTTIYVSYIPTGTAATTGAAVVVVEYAFIG